MISNSKLLVFGGRMHDGFRLDEGQGVIVPEGLVHQRIEDIRPLSGFDDPCVPQSLMLPLFGSGTAYALLDAAKVFGLPERLAASGLEHRCLFIGQALTDFADVAPWLIRLEPDAPFTRSLFVTGDAPWQLWDKEPGIVMRSPAGLDELWRHFRKFVKIRGPEGAWLYFRFWDGRMLRTTVDAIGKDAETLFPADLIHGVMGSWKTGSADWICRRVPCSD